MIQKKGLWQIGFIGAFATALLLPALAAAPAWAGECRDNKSMNVKGTDLEVATKIANQPATNTRVKVRVQDGTSDKYVQSFNDWKTIQDWTTLKAASGDSTKVTTTLTLEKNPPNTIALYNYVKVDIELPRDLGTATCQYWVQYLAYKDGTRNTTVSFEGCTVPNDSPVGILCDNRKKTSDPRKWTTTYTLTKPN